MKNLIGVHKRIREVNKQREDKGQKPMFSFLDKEIAAILNIIKEDVDAKVYDSNDFLKKDAYFGRTVMARLLVGDNADLHSMECYDPSAGQVRL